MLLSHARQTLDDAIEAHCNGRYCSPEKDAALARLIDDLPCILNTAGYHNQIAGNIASKVNNGGNLIALCDEAAHERTLFAPHENLEMYILPYLVGVNAEGIALLARATAHFAQMAEAA